MTTGRLFPYSAAELAAEARRELEMRRRVYPRWVAAGRMSQEQADKKIDLMRAIAENLETTDFALRESVKLQAHYAFLLNGWDGGKRIVFTSAEEWIERVKRGT